MAGNIVTPPDYINTNSHAVLVIDPVPSEIESLALLLSGTDTEFNIYVYLNTMGDLPWLESVVPRVSAIIINTEPNELSVVKDKLAVLEKSYHYGPRNFLMSSKRIESPIEYFAEESSAHLT